MFSLGGGGFIMAKVGLILRARPHESRLLILFVGGNVTFFVFFAVHHPFAEGTLFLVNYGGRRELLMHQVCDVTFNGSKYFLKTLLLWQNFAQTKKLCNYRNLVS